MTSASTEPNRIAAHTKIADHAAGGLALFTTENQKRVIKAIGAACLARVQEAENALWSLIVDTTILTATFAQLDQIGALLGLSRGALSDTQYRAVLRGLALANRSWGTANEHIAILDIILGEGAYTLTESFPAGLLVEPADAITPLQTALAEVLRRARSGGIGTGLIDPPDIEAFTFAPDEDVVEDNEHGFNETLLSGEPGTTGGAWAGVIET